VNGRSVLVLTSLLTVFSGAGAAIAGGDGDTGRPALGRAHTSQGDVQRFFASVDRNDDGFLTLEEVADEMGVSRTCLPVHLIPKEALERMSTEARQSLQADFDSADRNRDGRLSIGEVQRAVHETAVPGSDPWNFDDLEDGWNRLIPGGDTACALGGQYEFYVRPGARDRLLVFLDGGGGCWSRETCEPDSDARYTFEIEQQRRPGLRDGILDLQDPRNPFSEFSMVMVPYCTGDVHLGARVHTYESSEGSEPLVIRHLGHINATAVIDWIAANLDAPSSIVVTGLSAGSVATPFYADLLARRYPDSRVVGIGDGSGAWAVGTGPDLDTAPWGIREVFADEPVWPELDRPRFGIDEFSLSAAAPPGEPELYQIDFAGDANQARTLRETGTEMTNVLQLIEHSRARIRAVDGDFRAFTLGGDWHGLLTSPGFYVFREENQLAVDWVHDIVRGEPVSDVRCAECGRPHVTFEPSDLQLLDRALALLGHESAWDANPPPGASCPTGHEKRSIWCALVEAARQLDLGDWKDRAGSAEVVILATQRLGGGEPSLARYNNADGRKFEEVRSLLLEARANAAKALALRP